MNWNYRIIKRIFEKEVCFQIHEIYYNETGMIEHWTANPICPSGESLDELKNDCEHYLQALTLPVLIEIVDTDGVNKLIEWRGK